MEVEELDKIKEYSDVSIIFKVLLVFIHYKLFGTPWFFKGESTHFKHIFI